MDYYDYLDEQIYEEALCQAYGEYLDENCRCESQEECECMNLKQFEIKFLESIQDVRDAQCDY